MNGFENKPLVNKIIGILSKQVRRKGNYSITRLVCCPRKTYFKFTGVMEIRTDITELILARGRGHHGILEVFPEKEVAYKLPSTLGIPIWCDIDMKDEHPIEIFTTNMSARKVPEGDFEAAAKVFPLKFAQLKAECYFDKDLEGDLLVFFLMGDYNRFETDILSGKKEYVGIRPQLRAFHYQFEQYQLDEIWKLMNRNLEDIEHGKKTGRAPLSFGEEFECKNCGFSYICYSEEPIGKRRE